MLRPVAIRTDRSWGARGAVLGMMLLLAFAPGRACAQAPGDAGPKAKALPLARYVPREGLASYLEFDGLDAHEAAWKGSAANKLLNETRLGAVIEDIVRQLIAMSQAPIQPGDMIGAFEQLARQGMAAGFWGQDPEDLHFVTVLRGGGKSELRRLIDLATQAGPPVGQEVKKGGRTVHRRNESSWWFEQDDFVVTNQPDAVIAALDGQSTAAIDHPLRVVLRKGEGGFEPVAIGFVDFARLPALPPSAMKLGLDGLKRLELVLGFEGQATRTELRAIAPSPRRGVLALLDQPTFDAGTLPPVPAGVHGFVVASVDWAKTYDRAVEMLLKTAPPGGGGPDAAGMVEDQVRQQFGFDLRKDLIAGLGPKLTFSMQDPAGGGRGSRAAAMINRIGGATLALEVRDEAALSRAAVGLVKMINFVLANARALPPGAGKLELRQEPGGRPKYVLNLPEGLLPPPFSTMFRPTIILGPEQFVVAASTAAAERAAGLVAQAEGRWQPDGAFAPVMRRLPGKMVGLRISDPRDLLPAVVEALPVLARTINAQIMAQRQQFPGAPAVQPLRIEPDSLPRANELIPRLFPAWTALVVDEQGVSLVAREPIPGFGSPLVAGMFLGFGLPARMASREAAQRAQCINNLKQIGLAYHNFHSATNAFPAPAIADKDGKPLLSWRVAILPYLEQQELYNKFKLDEPWDSPHNKALIKEMPPVYLCPDRKNPEASTTSYRVFVGDGAMFQPGQGTAIQTITDGTSNTVLVVESSDAVSWTKPDDLKFDPNAKPSLYGAGSSHPGGFNVLFGDGAVRFIRSTINLQVWKALITRASGEVIAADAF